jgi:hypothetical protein
MLPEVTEDLRRERAPVVVVQPPVVVEHERAGS